MPCVQPTCVKVLRHKHDVFLQSKCPPTIYVQARLGPLHPRSLQNPLELVARLTFFPFLLLGRTGTIAADTTYYPFGTRMHVPGKPSMVALSTAPQSYTTERSSLSSDFRFWLYNG